jgi:hypothetical protein
MIESSMEKFYLRKIPPSRDALRHSGGERRRWTSATLTLYFEFELSNDNRPGTLQNTSVGAICPFPTPKFNCIPSFVSPRRKSKRHI